MWIQQTGPIGYNHVHISLFLRTVVDGKLSVKWQTSSLTDTRMCTAMAKDIKEENGYYHRFHVNIYNLV